jgi:hypothetical protein
MDDGKGGNYTSIVGGTSDSLATEYSIGNQTSGGLFRFRYRAKNVNGWSGFSPVAYIRAANVPARPPMPKLDSVN